MILAPSHRVPVVTSCPLCLSFATWKMMLHARAPQREATPGQHWCLGSLALLAHAFLSETLNPSLAMPPGLQWTRHSCPQRDVRCQPTA